MLVAATQRGDAGAAEGCGGGLRDVLVGDAGDVGAVGVDFQRDFEAVLAPVVADARGRRDGAKNVGDLGRDRAERGDVFFFVERADVGEAGDAEFDGIVDGIGLELADVDSGAGDVVGEGALEFADQFRRVVFVVDLDDDLRVVELLELRRDREPEARTAAAFEAW